jgi:cysteine-rich repeat protein
MRSGFVTCALALGLLARAALAQPAFTLPLFPIGEPGATAYTAPITSVLDHGGTFYTHCCDTETVAYTGEVARREDGELFCPVAAGDFPACLFASGCLCSYPPPGGGTFVITGSYTGFGGSHLLYDGHAGYDYAYGFGVPIVAPRAGQLCKAQEDLVNGRFGFASAWEKFHTFYVDHGDVGGVGHATWYLHASDLETPALQALAPGECAAVTQGEVVARVGNTGTGAPHLHFEAREYVPADGPEAASSRVYDPYGWTGTTPDPWETPGANPQAVHRAAPVWEGCGNGRLEGGETCDDGNAQAGDCCAADCTLEADASPCPTSDVCVSAGACSGGTCVPSEPAAAGTPCAADDDACTVDICDGAGACQIGPAPTCATCARCDAQLGCVLTPATGCRVDAGGTLVIRDREAFGKDRLLWKWTRGAATPAAALGDPIATDDYTLCLWDGT